MTIFTYLRLSAIILCSFVFTASHAQKEEDYFITVWDLSLDTNKQTSIEFAYSASGDVDYLWETIPAGQSGSGKLSSNTSIITISNLPLKKVIKLKLAPKNFRRFYFGNNFRPNSKLIDVSQWGNVVWASMELSFYYCENLNITATDLPILSDLYSMEGMFYKCKELNGPTNINQWNMQNVSIMSGMFSGATAFNQPIGNWNTKNIDHMVAMFEFATSFNQPIGNWNLQNARVLDFMFRGATSFNQPIGDWVTSNVLYMSYMFVDAKSFNQKIQDWDTKNVADLTGMFQGATAFNQRLDSFNINSSTSLYYMLDSSGLDCKNYSYTLIGWANNINTPINKDFGAAGLKYSSLAQTARDLLTKPVAQGGKGWTITGDSLSTEDCGVISGLENTTSISNITIYPNPAQDKLFLKNAAANTAYKIIDNLGRTLSSGICQNEEIAIDALPSGLYKLVYGNKYFTFVKE